MTIATCEQGSLVVSLQTVAGADAESDQEALSALRNGLEDQTATEGDLCVSQGQYFIPVDGRTVKETRKEVIDLMTQEAEGRKAISSNRGEIESHRLELERLKPPSTLSTLQRGGQGFLGGVASAWILFGIGVPLAKRFYSSSCDDGSSRVAWKSPWQPIVSTAVFTGGLWVIDHVSGEAGEPVILGGAADTSDPFASIPTNPEDLWRLKAKLNESVYGPGGVAAQRISSDRESTRLNEQLIPLRQSWANASWLTLHAPELIGGSVGTVFGFATTDYVEKKFFGQLQNRGILCRKVYHLDPKPVHVDDPVERRIYEHDGRPVTSEPWYEGAERFVGNNAAGIGWGLLGVAAAAACTVIVLDPVPGDEVFLPITAPWAATAFARAGQAFAVAR